MVSTHLKILHSSNWIIFPGKGENKQSFEKKRSICDTSKLPKTSQSKKKTAFAEVLHVRVWQWSYDTSKHWQFGKKHVGMARFSSQMVWRTQKKWWSYDILIRHPLSFFTMPAVVFISFFIQYSITQSLLAWLGLHRKKFPRQMFFISPVARYPRAASASPWR